MHFYVYGLIDPRTDEPFYIGKGSGCRVDRHETEARTGKLSHKCNYIRRLWAEGFEVSKVCYRRFRSEKAAYKFEQDLIAEIGLENLTNISPGGQIPIFVDPEEQRDRTMVDVLAVMIRKTAGFTVKRLWLYGGERHELPDNFYDNMKERLAEIILRRGFEWAKTQMQARRIILHAEPVT